MQPSSAEVDEWLPCIVASHVAEYMSIMCEGARDGMMRQRSRMQELVGCFIVSDPVRTAAYMQHHIHSFTVIARIRTSWLNDVILRVFFTERM